MSTSPSEPRKTFVVADIHGQAELLERLIARLPIDWAADDLVFLGDYVDRGPASRRVLEYVMALQARFRRVVALCGNHDVMMREALDDEETFKAWLHMDAGHRLRRRGRRPAVCCRASRSSCGLPVPRLSAAVARRSLAIQAWS